MLSLLPVLIVQKQTLAWQDLYAMCLCRGPRGEHAGQLCAAVEQPGLERDQHGILLVGGWLVFAAKTWQLLKGASKTPHTCWVHST